MGELRPLAKLLAAAAATGAALGIFVQATAVEPIEPNSIPMTVVTSTGEPVVGVILTAVGETSSPQEYRGCGRDEITPTDEAGHCTFYNMTPGRLYSIWLQGYPITGSGWAGPAYGTTYQPIILRVTGRQATPPAAHGGGSGLSGRALTSSGEYIPGIGVFSEGTVVQTDAQGNYSMQSSCCDVRVMGYLAGQGGYVNGSVRHAPTGAPATIVVVVGPAAAEATPTPAPTTKATTVPAPKAAPTSAPPTRTLAQTGQPRTGLIALLAMLLAGGLLVIVRFLGEASR